MFEIIHKIRDVSFCPVTVDIVLTSDMDLSITDLQPETTAACELDRFRNLS
jgi:hypothetical protein